MGVVVSSEVVVVDVEEVVVDVVVVEEATRFEDMLFDFDKRIKCNKKFLFALVLY